jgi:hypothetical protein
MQRNDKNVTNVTNGHTVEYATASLPHGHEAALHVHVHSHTTVMILRIAHSGGDFGANPD